MIAIVCIDDNYGMIFNNRRQSRDSILIQNVLEITKDTKLWISSYSSSLFPYEDNIIIDDEFLLKATVGEYCFVEKENLEPFEDKIEKIVVYKWNCTYPYDKVFDIDLDKWNLLNSSDFSGKSHEKITMEVYSK